MYNVYPYLKVKHNQPQHDDPKQNDLLLDLLETKIFLLILIHRDSKKVWLKTSQKAASQKTRNKGKSGWKRHNLYHPTEENSVLIATKDPSVSHNVIKQFLQ